MTTTGNQTGTVRRVVSTRMPTKWGEFQVLGFEREISNSGAPMRGDGPVRASLRGRPSLAMTRDNTALGGTAVTVSIDANAPAITTGISAYDRAQTIKHAMDPHKCAEDFARPGHVFPLCSRSGGVLERRGQTEAAVDLASLAGLYPAGVICEIVNDDGAMSRVPDLIRFCRMHDLVMITVAKVARYRFDQDYEGSLAAIEGLSPVCERHYSVASQ